MDGANGSRSPRAKTLGRRWPDTLPAYRDRGRGAKTTPAGSCVKTDRSERAPTSGISLSAEIAPRAKNVTMTFIEVAPSTHRNLPREKEDVSNSKGILLIAAAIALVVVVGASAQSDPQSDPQPDRPVTAWQHLALTVDLENDVKSPSGQINRLGRDGWQLVDVENFVAGGETTKTVYYFKRPQ